MSIKLNYVEISVDELSARQLLMLLEDIKLLSINNVITNEEVIAYHQLTDDEVEEISSILDSYDASISLIDSYSSSS